MTAIALALVAVAAVLSGSVTLAFFGVVYAMLQGLHHVAFAGLPADSFGPYYLLAMSFDVVSILILLLCVNTFGSDWHAKPLSFIMAASVFNDFYGYLAWRNYLAPDSFNVVGVGIYSAVFLLLAGSRYSGRMVGAFRRCHLGGGSFLRGRDLAQENNG